MLGCRISLRKYQTGPSVPTLHAQTKGKIEIEWGLLAIAQNLRKKAA